MAQEVRLVGPGGTPTGGGGGGAGAANVLTVAPGALTVSVGASAALTATLRDSTGTVLTGQTITWASSNSSIVTVTSAGVVTGRSPGTASIIASGGGVNGNSLVTVAQEPIASVQLSPGSATLDVGETLQLIATPRGAGGTVLTGRVVTWGTSNAGIASVDASGFVRSVAVGTATITATSEGQFATATITVVRIPVASVTVAPSLDTVAIGGTGQLTVTLRDGSGNVLTGRPVTWSSGSAAVGTVNSTGRVSGLTAGTTVVTALSEGQSGSATILVMPVAVASVTVTPVTAGLLVGGTQQYAATTRDANGAVLTGRVVTWASGNTGIATVSPTGLALGVALGATTVTATSEGQNGTSNLTVSIAPPTLVRVILTPDTAIVNTGSARQFTTQGRMSDSTTVPLSATFTATGGTVSGSGLYTAGATAGTFRVIANAQGRADTSAITLVLAPVASVTVSPLSGTLNTGATIQLTATLRDAAGTVLSGRVRTWTSSSPSVATVNGNGLVTGLTAGVATITITSEGQSAQSILTVVQPAVASLTVTPANSGMSVGSAVQLTATPRDANGQVLTGRLITWTSSNPAVATVSATGNVQGLGLGVVTITALCETRSATSTVTVATNSPPPPPGPNEPVFRAGVDTSLFFDGFESYAAAADLTSGSGAHRYITGGGGTSGMRIVTGTAGEGAKKLELNYQGTGEVSRLLETYDITNPTSSGPSTVIVTWLFRNTGNPYEGKIFIIFPSNAARFLHHGSRSRPYPDDLRSCFWNSSNQPLLPGAPSGQNLLPTWNRDDITIPVSGPDARGGYSYKQNVGAGSGGFNWTAAVADGNWHRFTTKFTKGPVYGQGRLEMWADGIKIMEYIGDNPARCEYGIVYTPQTSQQIVDGFQFPGPAAFNWPGGAYIEFDGMRVWNPGP